jgi:hypothetical protein
MAKSIRQRVSDSFDENEIAAVKEYSDKVYSTWVDTTSTLRRNAVFIFLVAAVFELLVYQKTSSTITFGAISVANSSIVQIALPAVLAFLVYDEIRLTTRWFDLEAAYYALIKKAMPKVDENDLDMLIKPVLPAFWAFGQPGSPKIVQRSEKFNHSLTVGIGIIVIFIFPLAFEGQAYYKLFEKFGYHNTFLLINVSLTVILLACTAIYYMIYDGEEF